MFHSFSTINALFTKLRNFLSLFWSLKLIITLITTQLNFKNSSRLQFFKIVLDLRDQRVGANLLLPPANEVWGKVIFLHLSVILFTGGVPGQVHLPPGTPPARYTPGSVHAGRYGQQAGGTHPTGMHSYLAYFLPKTAWKNGLGHFP